MKRLAIALALCTGPMACGGGASNSQLKRRVTHQHLAPLPAAERAQEADVYREVFLAAWQIEFTKSQITAAELEVKIANNDLASSKISLKSASLETKAADAGDDLNKIEEKKKGEHIAQLEIDMHKLNIERAKKNLAYLKTRLAYEERNHRSREAQLESIKADSLKSAGIKPPSFDAASYKAQFNDRQAQAKAKEAEVAQMHKEVKALEATLDKTRAALAVARAGGTPKAVEPAAPAEPLEPLEPVAPVEPIDATNAPEGTNDAAVPATAAGVPGPSPTEPAPAPAQKGAQ